MCLDVLRAMGRDADVIPACLDELYSAKGGHRLLDAAIANVEAELGNTENLELRARRVTERLAVGLQGALMVKHAPTAVADAFCLSRLGHDCRSTYGTLTRDIDLNQIVQRIAPWAD